MATNNATNTSNPVTVAQGGTGATSFTAYSVLCGGTTSTNPIQNVSGVGTSGQVFTSNGAGALPTWQNVTGGSGYSLTLVGNSNGTIGDSSTTFAASLTSWAISAIDWREWLCVPKNSTIKGASCVFTGGSGAVTEALTLYIRINDTTDVLVSNSVVLNASTVSVVNTSLNQAVSAGDYLLFKIVTPVYATNPSVDFVASIYLE